jgi:SAM-dependent methyltransferase
MEDRMTTHNSYVFAAERDGSSERFAALARLYDESTCRYVEALGISSGWNCLEVGAGGGSIASYLARRVTPGRVVATDREVETLNQLSIANLEVWRHDIASDPLAAGAFELVHARLVSMHLADPAAAIAKMAAALRPGGWLILEEFDAPLELDIVDGEVTDLRTSAAFRLAIERSGVELRFGKRLPAMLRAQGLVSIAGEARTSLWTGAGSSGSRLMRANYLGLRDAMIATGTVTADDIDADLLRLDDPQFVTLSPTMWSVWGRVPIITS